MADTGSCYITVRQASDGPRFIVRYREGGRGFAVKHAGSFRDRELAEVRKREIDMKLARRLPPQPRVKPKPPTCISFLPEGGKCRRATSETVAGQPFCADHIAQLRAELLVRRRFVYFAERAGLIKIGIAEDPGARVKGLGAELLAVEDGGRLRESELHLRFAHLRTQGEWFQPEPELLAHVAGLNGNGGDPA